MYGARLRECMVEVNDIRLANRERFCFKARLENGDTIKIIPIGEGLWGGSQKNAVTPPLGEDESKAAPAAEEALPTYQQSIEAAHSAHAAFTDHYVEQFNIQPVPDNNQQMDDDDEDVYKEEEEKEEKLSIADQIFLAQQKLNTRKRKLEELDAEYERVEKEDHEAKHALQQINLFNAQQTLLAVITEFPMYLSLLHTRALQIQYIAYTIEGYLNNPREDTPIEFQNQRLSSMFQRLQQLDDYEDVDELIKLALAFTVSSDD
jgi:hypothetical protein